MENTTEKVLRNGEGDRGRDEKWKGEREMNEVEREGDTVGGKEDGCISLSFSE